ncbi:MAG TPA: hypothetical protein VI759_04240 [Dehalococcoidia bacterium]|nr:hypothetical protein [Dehalococcoidia bacterium]
MIRSAAIAVCLLALVLATRASASAPVGTTIEGGDLPHAVRLAPADEDAFLRRLANPPQLRETPPQQVGGYEITSAYWDTILRDGLKDVPSADDKATYYPATGYVKARQGGKDVWLQLDVRQRTLLDRYIRVTRAGLVSERPGVLEVIIAASATEPMAVEIGGVELNSVERNGLFMALSRNGKPIFLDPAEPPNRDTLGTWLVFSLSEGRSVSMIYGGPQPNLVDGLGTERYPASPEVANIINLYGPKMPPSIEQEETRGSYLWWPLMLGGGAALLVAAVLLRRVLTRGEPHRERLA